MRIRKDRLLVLEFIFISLIICMVFSNIKVFSYLSLASYIVYWLYLYRFDKIFFVKYLAFIFSALSTVVGAFVIELLPETYLPELRCQSHFSGSLPLLIFSYWVFLFVLEIKEYHYGNSLKIQVDFNNNIKAKKIINILSLFSGVTLLILFLYVATHSTLSVDRFNFYLSYEMPDIISRIGGLSYLLLVFPMLAMVYGNRFIATISVGLYCAYNFWIGEKFGAFFTMICIFFMVFYNKILSLNRNLLKKILRYIIVVVLSLIIIAVFIISNRTGRSGYDYLIERTSQQGQLWWKTYDLYQGEFHPAEFINEIWALFEGDKPIRDSIGAQNGIYKAMYLCAPNSVVTGKLQTGSRYTQGDYAVVYYYFGVPGVIVYSILMGIVISGIVNSFIVSLQEKMYIKALIYLRFFRIIRTSFSMFTFGSFLSMISILSYIYLTLTHGRHYKFMIHGKTNFRFNSGKINV